MGTNILGKIGLKMKIFILIGIAVIGATTSDPDYSSENNELNSTFSSSDDTIPPWIEKILQNYFENKSLEEAAGILSSLNTSVDPCDNFYEFACSGWLEKNPRPDNTPVWSVFSQLTKKTTDLVIKILETPAATEDIRALIQAKHFYQTCVNADNNRKPENDESTSLQLMWNTLEEFGGWPILYENGTWDKYRFNWITSTVGLQRKLASTVLINAVSLQYPYWRQKMNTIFFTPPKTSSSSSIGIIKTLVDYKELFEGQQSILDIHKLIVDISKVFLESQGKLDINQTYLEDQAADIIFVQSALNRKDKIQDQVLLNNWDLDNVLNTTVAKMQNLLDIYAFPYSNELNILEFLRSLYENTDIWIDDDQPIVVTDPVYFLKLSKLITTIRQDALANFLHFRMILEMIPRSDNTNLKALLDKFENGISGTTGAEERTTFCAQVTQDKFLFAVGQAYVNSRQGVESKFTEVNRIFGNLKLAFLELIDDSDVPYLNETLLKRGIGATDLCLGYPLWINNNYRVQSEYDGLILSEPASFLELSMEINSWAHTKKLGLLTEQLQKPIEYDDDACVWTEFPGYIGAYNALLEYSVYIPIGILQAPFFNGHLPMAINYGKLGSILGHELAHSLDVPGWSELKDGSLTPSGQCLVEQYDNFTTIEINLTNVTSNGVQTLKENIPDNVGLLAAYRAFQNAVSKSIILDRKKPTSLEIFSDDQLFFLGFAQNWCETLTPNALSRSIKKDDHPPGIFRALGTLKNSKEFAKAWNCPLGSEMNLNSVEREKLH